MNISWVKKETPACKTLLLDRRAKATITLILGLRRSKQSGRVPRYKIKNELVRKFAMALPAISTKISANPLGLRKSNPIYCVPVYKISITWTREQPRSSDLQACCRKKEKRAQPELVQKAR
jgi:hypothetical protein